jgi:hypothetical protein
MVLHVSNPKKTLDKNNNINSFFCLVSWHLPTSDKVYQLLAHGRWFSPGITASSTTKTGRHDIAEILLKVALNTKNQSINQSKKFIRYQRNNQKP